MATFWTGSSVTFTNGQKTATVGTGDDISSIYPNSVAMVNGIPYEVAKAYTSGSPTIELEKNWPLATGTHAVTIFPSAAAAAKAGQTAQTLMTSVSTLVNSASATATANSFAKRDANGRLLVAASSSASHAVNRGELGSSAWTAATTGATDTTGMLRAEDAYAASSKNWHDGNVNFDTSYGGGVNDYFAVGYAYSATGLRVLKSIIALNSPTSLIIDAGTNLEIIPVDFGTAQIVSANTYLIFRGDSTNKMLSMDLSGATGLTQGQTYFIRFNTAGKNIKWA